MEYPDSCSTTIRRVVRKAGLYNLEMILPQGCDFQTGGIAYDNIKHIVIITDSLYTAKRIFKLSLHL